MTNQIEKTHWLQNPNKNYLGHWDLPNGEDVILTIKSAAWEEVKNPITRTSEAKRVIRFEENAEWIKPFICNEVNAQSILKSTGQKFMEDCQSFKIKLGVGRTKIKGEEIDCLRVRIVAQNLLASDKISEEEVTQLCSALEKAGKPIGEFCKAMRIVSVKDLPSAKFKACLDRLNQISKENANHN